MPQYVLNRDYTLRNTKGVITFTKGQPTNVPPYMEMDVVAIGAEAFDKTTPSLVPQDEDEARSPEGEDRQSQILTAISLLVEKNDASDFTAMGSPSVKAVEGVLGFDIDRSELIEAWKKFNAGKA
jgi:hypothetical protein